METTLEVFMTGKNGREVHRQWPDEVKVQSRESQASFRCCQCGLRAHADHNAANNILRRNTASMIVEEGQLLSVEAMTIGGASCPLGNPPLASRGRC
ncbi:zinc ribbon domain-containing protein [Rhizobium mongolense]|uniref:Cas12f1-like TNB domain-containing protein n=2 Tax=Rhizobium mongolense TaxID=57676 RepID=A0ABR6IN98_9HYPH|nr:zinc ribbon domain-containing protein [Rhizobium mongolense]MBB4229367.1 hypothetical protein [Rhizobium mongolense]